MKPNLFYDENTVSHLADLISHQKERERELEETLKKLRLIFEKIIHASYKASPHAIEGARLIDRTLSGSSQSGS